MVGRPTVFYGTQGTDILPEPLGFIGVNCQRFSLHYTSMRQDPASPCVYRVSGKMRVKANAYTFISAITVTKAQLYEAPSSEYPQFAGSLAIFLA